MVFKARPCQSRWEGLLVTGWILLVDLLLIIWMARRSVDWLQFLLLVLVLISLPLLAHLAWRTWAAWTLEYWVDRNAVTVRWGLIRQIVPLHRIRRVIEGGIPDLGQAGLLEWPAPYLRRARGLGLLSVHMFATVPLSQCLLLETDEAVFAISPAEPTRFLDALQEHYRLGPVRDLPIYRQEDAWWLRLLSQEGMGVWLLLGGFVGTILLFGYLMIHFPNLPDALAFHYNSNGLPDVIRAKTALFLLPAIGLLTWVVNGLWGLWMIFRRQRTGAYMLWGGTLIVQICSLLALHSLILNGLNPG